MEALDLPREHIGPYRLEARLGRGGMGEVFLAFDERLERRVAIKRVRWGPETTAATHERFRREARAAARLNHPAIVQVYDLVVDDEGDAIVMEYVLGRPLSALLGDPALTPAFAVRLAREIAQGLAHAHEAGFLHRDLKAENVMVTGAGHAKILDFGLARPVVRGEEESLTADGTVLGTFHAMSPEQAGGGEVDERSDLFSLGALLYEMLSGRSPFRGESPLATLKRVLTEAPVPLGSLRPDLPRELAALVDRLLAKDSAARPGSASEVDRSLAEIAGLASLPAVSGERLSGETLSELPTGPAPAVVPRRRPSAASTSGMSALRRRPRAAYTVAAVLLALAAAGGVVLLYERGRAPAPLLRVLVAPPTVSASGDPRLTLAASGVLDAALSSLASLQGLAPLDPNQLGGTEKSPVDMARTAAADEVLLAAVQPQGEIARVSLRRISGRDGRVLWAEAFPLAADPADLRLLPDAVALYVRRAWPDYPPRPGAPAVEVQDGDYAAYLALRQRLDGGQAPQEPELARIEAILRRSPRFLPAQLTAADISLSLFASSREPRYLERARALAEQAAALAPGDPRPLIRQFRVALEQGRDKEPEAAFARLAAAMPGDPEIHLYHSLLAAQSGKSGEALADLRTATQHIPSWRNLYRLADLEQRSGQLAEAREHLGILLTRAPKNLWGLQALAAFELSYGDPNRAERFYRDLVAIQPGQRALWTGLGLARALAGRDEAALEAYRQALAIEPDHIIVLLNLADSELALGRKSDAQAHYRRTLERLAQVEKAAALRPDDHLIQAQCLAHLGRFAEAAEIVQRALRQSPDSPDLLASAALVYALIGDRVTALINAKEALRQGKGASWFRSAAFAPLREDPDFRSQLAARALP